jgi:hypothetical protein
VDLDLVGAQAQPVAVAQIAGLAAADRLALTVHKGAVGRKIGDLPSAGIEGDNAVALREAAFGIGEDPVVFRAAADRELAAGDRTRFRCDVVGTAQHRESERHPLFLVPAEV